MKIQEIYKKLKNVKIIDIEGQQRLFSYWLEDEGEEVRNNNWVAIFHNKYKKYLVTNDISICGLNEEAKNIEIIGFANDLNYMMFAIYEHQKARGLEITIEDEIKELIMKEVKKMAEEEWSWAKPDDKKNYRSNIWFSIEN
jgi:hypothetical protein